MSKVNIYSFFEKGSIRVKFSTDEDSMTLISGYRFTEFSIVESLLLEMTLTGMRIFYVVRFFMSTGIVFLIDLDDTLDLGIKPLDMPRSVRLSLCDTE
jgi:hypothetical protein